MEQQSENKERACVKCNWNGSESDLAPGGDCPLGCRANNIIPVDSE